MMALRQATKLRLNLPVISQVRAMSGEPGSGAGTGGGAGGTIKESGGSFGKREAALEEQYFRKMQSEQIKRMKEGLKIEKKYHEEQIKMHQDAIKRHDAMLHKLGKSHD
ncbi:ATPase inhibitor mai-2, mitochondrial-like [Oratosquilla oratoria]|uniref:ATPase inhibitor mai-2, mitochondrial-like n=1 Tax=Oratosquilla oratoria TaxID=337810 RepID=UPI003F757285